MTVEQTSSVNSRPPAEFVDPSGEETVDGLVHGTRFSAETGQTVTTITFSFPTANSTFSTNPNSGYGTEGGEPHVGFEPVGELEQNILYAALSDIEKFANIDFVEVPDTGDQAGTIRIAWTGLSDENSIAWAYLPSSAEASGDIWLLSENLSRNDATLISTIYHELGHAIGLKHPHEEHDDFGLLPSALDGEDWTIMSYNVSGRYPDATWSDLEPQSFMYYDILALQYIYGANENGSDTDDSYIYDLSDRYHLTIWDTGGTDTLGVTGSGEDVVINLTPGSWQSIGTVIRYGNGFSSWTDSETVYVPPEVTIENAYGADGNDRITGNDVSNVLEGKVGADRVIGGAGNDVVDGGAGNDTLRGDSGDDIVSGGAGNDVIFAGSTDDGDDVVSGGAGSDVIGGSVGDDFLIGGGADDGTSMQLFLANNNSADDGTDTLFGGDGDDTLLGGGWDDGLVNDNGAFDAGEQITSGTSYNALWGGEGQDLIYGADGSDEIGGGFGQDTVYAGDGADVVYAGRGTSNADDVLYGGGGADTLFGSSGDDRVFGDSGNDLLFNGSGNDTVQGGGGNDTLWGGGGNDLLTGDSGSDTFAFAAGNGDDTITDFDVNEDALFLAGVTAAFTSLQDVLNASTNSTVDGVSGVLINTGGGDSVFLQNVTVDDLSSATITFE